mgnify:CR=1 FL=1
MKRTNLLVVRYLPFFFMWMVSFCMFAQDITIKGNIVDSKKTPLIGVTVVVKGTINGLLQI